MADELTRRVKGKMETQQAQLVRRTRQNLRILNNWWKIAVAIISIYVLLPFAAPTLMKAGATGPANAIYTVYSPLCHQFAFRSLFLFGDQPYYPRADAEGRGSLDSFEERAARSDEFVALYTERRKEQLIDEGRREAAANYVFDPAELDDWTPALQSVARNFRGDAQMGYKVALCQRDIAIYVSLAVGAVAYGFVRHRLRPCPIWLYLLLGILPIGLDGFSQMLGYPPFELWEARETAPLFRALTGSLFGLMSVWLAFPYINLSVEDSIQRLKGNIAYLDDQVAQLDRQR